ncbi:MAG: hypothetical protein DME76_20025, partial [Verrucomicrobia bacterium]
LLRRGGKPVDLCVKFRGVKSNGKGSYVHIEHIHCGNQFKSDQSKKGISNHTSLLIYERWPVHST